MTTTKKCSFQTHTHTHIPHRVALTQKRDRICSMIPCLLAHVDAFGLVHPDRMSGKHTQRTTTRVCYFLFALIGCFKAWRGVRWAFGRIPKMAAESWLRAEIGTSGSAAVRWPPPAALIHLLSQAHGNWGCPGRGGVM